MRIALGAVLAVAALVVLPAKSEAVALSFDCVAQSSGTNPSCSSFEAAYQVQIDPVGTDDVFFRFFNNGLAGYDTGSITKIYFDVPDPNPFSNNTWNYEIEYSSLGVVFLPDLVPNGPIAGFDAAYKAESLVNGLTDYFGVQEGESAAFRFDRKDGFTFNNILSALTNGSLRMALYVESLDPRDKKSALFVNNPYAPTNPTPVPEPASLILFGSGLAGLAGMARRARRKKAAIQ